MVQVELAPVPAADEQENLSDPDESAELVPAATSRRIDVEDAGAASGSDDKSSSSSASSIILLRRGLCCGRVAPEDDDGDQVSLVHQEAEEPTRKWKRGAWLFSLFFVLPVATFGVLVVAAEFAHAAVCTRHERKECVKMRRRRGFVFDPASGLKLDFYRPPEASRRPPVMVFLHKGGFLKGKRASVPCGASGACSQFLFQNSRPPLSIRSLTQQGIAVLTVDYRLCGGDNETLYPGPLRDVQRLVAWLRSPNASSLEIDPTLIGCFGMSAGAGLCSALAVSGEVDVGVAFSTWSDWFQADNADGFKCRHVPICAAAGERFQLDWAADRPLTALPEEYQSRLRNMSLVTAVDEGSTAYLDAANTLSPLMLLHGDEDNCHPTTHAKKLARAYRRRGTTVKKVVTKGLGHSICHPPSAEEKAMEFLTRRLLKKPRYLPWRGFRWFSCR